MAACACSELSLGPAGDAGRRGTWRHARGGSGARHGPGPRHRDAAGDGAGGGPPGDLAGRRGQHERPGWRTEAAQWCKSLEAMGEAGIDTLIYTWHSNVGARHMNWHTAVDVPIRGGARAEAFRAIDLPENARTAPIQAHEEDLWVALEQFLQACLPAADANGVRMAMHPADPQVPMIAGMPRIMRWLCILCMGSHLLPQRIAS